MVVAREVALQGEDRGGRSRILGRIAKIVLCRDHREPLCFVHEGGQGGGVLVAARLQLKRAPYNLLDKHNTGHSGDIHGRYADGTDACNAQVLSGAPSE